jgi:hypothetical protein
VTSLSKFLILTSLQGHNRLWWEVEATALESDEEALASFELDRELSNAARERARGWASR